MISFLFPEDLDPYPAEQVQSQFAAPPSKKLQDAFPVASSRPRRPVPIYVKAPNEKSKDDVVVSVARLSLDDRPARLAKAKEKKPMLRWKSVSNHREDREERQMRMALAEAERVAHEHSRIDRDQKDPYGLRIPLAPLEEERGGRDGRNSPREFDHTTIMF